MKCECGGHLIVVSWFWKPEIRRYMVELQCVVCDSTKWVEMTRKELGVK